MTDSREYTIIVRNARESERVLSDRDRQLPRITITFEGRIHQRLIEYLRRELGAQALCICESRPGIVLVEVREKSWAPPEDLRWQPNSAIVAKDRAILDEAVPARLFTEVGWMDNVQEWIRPHIARYGVSLTGAYEQFGAGPACGLLRFETTGRPIWFKAVAEPLRQEKGTTETLSKRYGIGVPEVIASNHNWNAWLMWEAPGRPLAEFDATSPEGLEAWRRSASALAELQQVSIGDEARLLRVGCADWRTPTAFQKLDHLLCFGKEAMRRQPSSGPCPLTDSEIDEVGEAARALLSEAKHAGIPDTLMHGDLNPTNILVAPDRVTFIDWAEGWVSQPMLGFEYLAAHLRKGQPGVADRVDSVRNSYLQPWPRNVASAIEGLSDRFPVLALLIYTMAVAQSRNRINDGTQQDRGVRSYLRRLHREVRSLKQEVA